ncbi:hypothetical protein DEA8626_01364 [Defluviimonas aquaemixtae]|uniref:Uncharacterized protein n=2 Tax=Albidovulum aquaemixtae TaxID=1542388 RepID=A0A2R8B5I2_9RHOB|nr:hypothetical protein DEA8626_01364 [Defluviimonas aquaemixtae]
MHSSERLDPTDRPALQPAPLIKALAKFKVRWVLCGSQVLALHGAGIVANDLDVVPHLESENLRRVAACLEYLRAVAAYLDGWGGERGTLEACRAWRPVPPTSENLDWLFVTHLGMLDIVIEKADPYESLMDHAEVRSAGGTPYWLCDPRRVLKALEGRARKKDRERDAIYRLMRRRLGMPELP